MIERGLPISAKTHIGRVDHVDESLEYDEIGQQVRLLAGDHGGREDEAAAARP
ncbi:hypothetical protein [Sphingomonas japonica]|uniref:Tetrahydromethanopterin S-methyltransferase subunit F n=1 Tax=Sphingomonas japonica TaxID=511662 RepID=A0ABX0TVX3_9SPHN|nr:hypothetical protein [Sphingomonas japonica]NIJ22460.1 tetrahydromethanopterin S-methyltransferase subunit F [Sphingomonas japonica]